MDIIVVACCLKVKGEEIALMRSEEQLQCAPHSGRPGSNAQECD